MTRLPLIVGFGGYNAAGRSSGHVAYQRLIYESLSQQQQADLVSALANLMGARAAGLTGDARRDFVLQGTLVRRIEPSCFDVDRTPTGKLCRLSGSESRPVHMTLSHRDLPHPLPPGWRLVDDASGSYNIEITQPVSAVFPATQEMPVQAAGQLPTGFDPAALYKSTHHPRGLQLSILAASDAVRSVGIEWPRIVAAVRPDEIGVYSSSVMSQLDNTGLGGMLQARRGGERVTSKQLALGLNTMPADFVNAYVLGSVGVTGGITGACATFLYNLRAGVEDIKAGRRRVVLVGSAEAPLLPEVIDGYSAMGALATDADLRKLGGSHQIDYRRASRPFGENCGFTLAESGQYVVLMDDELALSLGAEIYASVPGIFVNADGYKKSISAPGPGNYITFAKAVALASNLLGVQMVQRQSFIQAHGSSTPQNRITESRIFDQVARAFGVENWPVAAVKAYVGHSLGPASGDQMAATLGVFARGILPGIKTIDKVADDVRAQRLSISNRDQELGTQGAQLAFLNSKGFGGNNATATLLAPSVTEGLLGRRHGAAQWRAYLERREAVRENASAYLARAAAGQVSPIYEFGSQMMDEERIELDRDQIRLPGFAQTISLRGVDGFDDLLA